MRPDDIRDLLQRHPFQPIRLHLTGGTVFEIRHPDGAIVGRSVIKISLPVDNSVEREAVISLLHIIWVEIIVSTT